MSDPANPAHGVSAATTLPDLLRTHPQARPVLDGSGFFHDLDPIDHPPLVQIEAIEAGDIGVLTRGVSHTFTGSGPGCRCLGQRATA